MTLPLALLSQRRLVMHLAQQGLPEVPLLGRYNYAQAGPGLAEHKHDDIMEICFLVKGRQTYGVAGRDYHLRGGDIFVTFPNEWHSSAGAPEEKGILYWMMLRKTRGSFFGLSGEQSRVLWKSLSGLSPRHFRGSSKMKEQLDTLTVLFHGALFPLRPAYLASAALAFLLEVLDCASQAGQAPNSAGRLEGVFRHIQTHLDENLSVPQLAAIAGLSTPRFKARFKEETGVPPGEYVLRAKIAEAQRRLTSGRETVTEVAFGLEFSSSQYFATVFKRYTGKTPSQAVGRVPVEVKKAAARKRKPPGDQYIEFR